MKSVYVLMLGSGLLLAAIMRPDSIVQLLTVLLRIPGNLINTTAGLTRGRKLPTP